MRGLSASPPTSPWRRGRPVIGRSRCSSPLDQCPSPSRGYSASTAVFARVVVGVDGTEWGFEALRQTLVPRPGRRIGRPRRHRARHEPGAPRRLRLRLLGRRTRRGSNDGAGRGARRHLLGADRPSPGGPQLEAGERRRRRRPLRPRARRARDDGRARGTARRNRRRRLGNRRRIGPARQRLGGQGRHFRREAEGVGVIPAAPSAKPPWMTIMPLVWIAILGRRVRPRPRCSRCASAGEGWCTTRTEHRARCATRSLMLPSARRPCRLREPTTMRSATRERSTNAATGCSGSLAAGRRGALASLLTLGGPAGPPFQVAEHPVAGASGRKCQPRKGDRRQLRRSVDAPMPP